MNPNERIEKLIARAGIPIAIVKNPDKIDPFYREMERLVMPKKADDDTNDQYCDLLYCDLLLSAVETLAKEKQELVDLVDRLEVALENVLLRAEES